MTKDERIEKIIEMRKKRMSFAAIGEEFGISKQAVCGLINRRNRRLSTGIRGKGFSIDKIVYQGIYDYFDQNEYETLTSFCEKVFGYVVTIRKFEDFICGKGDVRFTLDRIKKICEVIGEPFEVVFALRKNMED